MPIRIYENQMSREQKLSKSESREVRLHGGKQYIIYNDTPQKTNRLLATIKAVGMSLATLTTLGLGLISKKFRKELLLDWDEAITGKKHIFYYVLTSEDKPKNKRIEKPLPIKPSKPKKSPGQPQTDLTETNHPEQPQPDLPQNAQPEPETLSRLDRRLLKALENPQNSNVLSTKLANPALQLALKKNLLNKETFNLMQNADTLNLARDMAYTPEMVRIIFENCQKITHLQISFELPYPLSYPNALYAITEILYSILEKDSCPQITLLSENSLDFAFRLLLHNFNSQKFIKLYQKLSLQNKRELIHAILQPHQQSSYIIEHTLPLIKIISYKELKEAATFIFEKNDSDSFLKIAQLIELSVKDVKIEKRQKRLQIILDVASKKKDFVNFLVLLKLYKFKGEEAEFMDMALRSLSKEQLKKFENHPMIKKESKHPERKLPSLLHLSLPKAIENPIPGVILPEELATPGLEIAVNKKLLNKETLTLVQNAEKLIVPQGRSTLTAEEFQDILTYCPKINYIRIFSEWEKWNLKFLLKKLSIILKKESLPPGFTLDLKFKDQDVPFWLFLEHFDEQNFYKLYQISSKKTKKNLIREFYHDCNRLETNNTFEKQSAFFKHLTNEELETFIALLFESIDKPIAKSLFLFYRYMGGSTHRYEPRLQSILNAMSKTSYLTDFIISIFYERSRLCSNFLKLAVPTLSEEQLKRLANHVHGSFLKKKKNIIDLMTYAIKSSDTNEILKTCSIILGNKEAEFFPKMIRVKDFPELKLYVLLKDFKKYGRTVLLDKEIPEDELRMLLLKMAEVCEIQHLDTLIGGLKRYENDFHKDLQKEFLNKIEKRNEPELTEKFLKDSQK